MRRVDRHKYRLIRLPDLLIPTALFLSSLLGRDDISHELFIALYMSRLCGLASASGLRSAFSGQPSIRYAQGSALLALLLQAPGSILALFLMKLVNPHIDAQIVICGALLNIEHVFYEYLYAIGDEESAFLCEIIAFLFTLAGLLICAPPHSAEKVYYRIHPRLLLIATSIPALVGLSVSIALFGRPHPRLNLHLLKYAPHSMLQVASYPALALLIHRVCFPKISSLPIFSGLIVYELCRAPFRRSPREAAPMNRVLLTLCTASILVALPFMTGRIAPENAVFREIPYICVDLVLASACGFCLYGNARRCREKRQRRDKIS